jgi:5-oxoprolinase (ATP-hydrolysing) subunit A
MRIDLNCDMGESFGAWRMGDDEAIMPLITSANIACGFHAGDPQVMRRTVRLAREHGVSVGAHPGFGDLIGFGRRPLSCTPEEIYADVLYQVGALDAVCRAEKVRLHHVKPHGALYNMAAADPVLAAAVAAAVADFDRSLILFALPGSELHRAGEAAGLRVSREAFADRAYNEDGSLLSRRLPGAVLESEEVAAEQVRRLVRDGQVIAVTGKPVPVQAETVCVHGDNPHAGRFLSRIRRHLEAEGVTPAPPFTP